MFVILQSMQGQYETLGVLVDFARNDPPMDTGWLFRKMRLGCYPVGQEKMDCVTLTWTFVYIDFVMGR